MTTKVTALDLVKSAERFELAEVKSFSKYVSQFVLNGIWASGIGKIKQESMGYSKQGGPINIPDKKGRTKVIGEVFSFNAPEIGQDYGYIISDLIHMKIQFTVFVIKRKLYMSSYSYHFELLEDNSKFFRYEKSEYVSPEESNYKPMLHMHSMGRLPHYPAPFVTVDQLLKNLQSNLFNPANSKRTDPPWGDFFKIG